MIRGAEQRREKLICGLRWKQKDETVRKTKDRRDAGEGDARGARPSVVRAYQHGNFNIRLWLGGGAVGQVATPRADVQGSFSARGVRHVLFVSNDTTAAHPDAIVL